MRCRAVLRKSRSRGSSLSNSDRRLKINFWLMYGLATDTCVTTREQRKVEAGGRRAEKKGRKRREKGDGEVGELVFGKLVKKA